jgi:hypothetical protein
MLVANRAFTLAGVALEKGDAIPAEGWDKAGERNRRAMLAGKYVRTTDTAVVPRAASTPDTKNGNIDPLTCPVAACQGRVFANRAAIKAHLKRHIDKGEYTPPQEH